MDIGLKSALILSVLIHAGVMAPLYNQRLLKIDLENKNSVIVDYVILKELTNIRPANVKTDISAPGAVPAVQGAKKEPASARASADQRAEYRKRFLAARAKEAQKARTDNVPISVKSDAEKTEASIRSSRDYIVYFNAIKDSIRSRLKDNYRHYVGEGEVYVSFVLNTKGSLVSYEIDRSKSTKDEVLLQITRTSLVAVAPFGPLPTSIAAPKRSFNITVSFRK
jgi:hypothetical protein